MSSTCFSSAISILEKLFFNLSDCEGIRFAEVPLLFESDLSEKFDKILVVMRPKSDRVSSVLKRDACTKEEIEQKISMQFDYEKALKEGKFSDEKFYLIFNDGDLEDLKNKLEDFLKTIV